MLAYINERLRYYSREEIESEELRPRMVAFAEFDMLMAWYGCAVLLFLPYALGLIIGGPAGVDGGLMTGAKILALVGAVVYGYLVSRAQAHQNLIREVLTDLEVPFKAPDRRGAVRRVLDKRRAAKESRDA